MSLKLSDGTTQRKANKPLMEKRRRARINRCLNELKQIIMEKSREQTTASQSKWEKADILEMTLAYIKSLQEMTVSAEQQFISGYRKCVEKVDKFAESGIPSSSIVSLLREDAQKMEENVDYSQVSKSVSSGSPQMSPANTSNSSSPLPSDSATPDLATEKKEASSRTNRTLPPTVIPPFLPFMPPSQTAPHYQAPNPLMFVPNLMCNPTPPFPNPHTLFWRPF
ncbi:hypothetical protein QR680_003176 [Steinernema hermaphroditum]|uniref:BHLH domain-containing protein n=1 Tax=Steinernema hermaphroditum TaxID=289476 RepID=A0AA39H6P5_9BILA|nr:hypothetical protein QR680_003176 [Steinernema hermaphroditum]